MLTIESALAFFFVDSASVLSVFGVVGHVSVRRLRADAFLPQARSGI